MKATELRIWNIVGCKVSNDNGIYQVSGIDGFERCFKTEQDRKQYHKNDLVGLDKHVEVSYWDERRIRISGGARDGEFHIESKIKGIKLTEEWLVKFGFKKGKNLWLDEDVWLLPKYSHKNNHDFWEFTIMDFPKTNPNCGILRCRNEKHTIDGYKNEKYKKITVNA